MSSFPDLQRNSQSLSLSSLSLAPLKKKTLPPTPHDSGVDHLRLGGRDDAGVLRSLDALEVSSLPRWAGRSSRGRARWTAEGIVEHGGGVLDRIVEVAREHGGRHLRFQYRGEGGGGFGGGGGGGGRGRGSGGGRFGGGGGGGFGAASCGRITATEVTGGNLGERIREALRDERVAGGAGAGAA